MLNIVNLESQTKLHVTHAFLFLSLSCSTVVV